MHHVERVSARTAPFSNSIYICLDIYTDLLVVRCQFLNGATLQFDTCLAF